MSELDELTDEEAFVMGIFFIIGSIITFIIGIVYFIAFSVLSLISLPFLIIMVMPRFRIKKRSGLKRFFLGGPKYKLKAY